MGEMMELGFTAGPWYHLCAGTGDWARGRKRECYHCPPLGTAEDLRPGRCERCGKTYGCYCRGGNNDPWWYESGAWPDDPDTLCDR